MHILLIQRASSKKFLCLVFRYYVQTNVPAIEASAEMRGAGEDMIPYAAKGEGVVGEASEDINVSAHENENIFLVRGANI